MEFNKQLTVNGDEIENVKNLTEKVRIYDSIIDSHIFMVVLTVIVTGLNKFLNWKTIRDFNST